VLGVEIMKREVWDWHFKALNPVDCHIIITLHAMNSILKDLYAKAVTRLKRIKKLDVSGNPEVISRFEIPHQYLRFVGTTVNKQLKKVRKLVLKDGIVVVREHIDTAYFIRNKENDWDIVIRFKGEYANRR
jgi:hypothetical protein